MDMCQMDRGSGCAGQVFCKINRLNRQLRKINRNKNVFLRFHGINLRPQQGRRSARFGKSESFLAQLFPANRFLIRASRSAAILISFRLGMSRDQFAAGRLQSMRHDLAHSFKQIVSES